MAGRITRKKSVIHPLSDYNYNPAQDNSAGIPQTVFDSAKVEFTDGVTNGTTTLTSAAGKFLATHVGRRIKLRGGTGAVAFDGTITGFTSATSVTLSGTVPASTGVKGTVILFNLGLI